MSFMKKLKDILFEEEEYTEPIKIRDEKKEEDNVTKIEIKDEPIEELKVETPKREKEAPSERELFKSDNTFQFPDFDEEEFQSNIVKPKINPNVLEIERKKTVEKRTDYGRYERIETREYTEKKKFKPSPIISPVYGILNQDYKAEDIVKKSDNASTINIEEVRKKAFEPKKELDEDKTIDPVVTFFEEKDAQSNKSEDNYKSIDDLLEEASDEISLEDTLELSKTNNLDVIEEELEKIETAEEKQDEKKDIDDTLDNDLFELIDSMYDEREEG